MNWFTSNAVTGHPGVQLSLSVYITDLGFREDDVAVGDSAAVVQTILKRIALL